MWIELATSAAAAAAIGVALSWIMIRAGVLDAPTAPRKVQKLPTPTSGGMAIGAGFAGGLAVATLGGGWAATLGPDAIRSAAFAAGFAFVTLALGLRDDIRPIDARLKMAILTVLALVFAAFVARAEALPLTAELSLPIGPILGTLGSALWIFTLVNATNFVDGANGLAMGSTAIGLTALAIIGLAIGAPHVAVLCFCGAAAILGFLVWNFPGGKIFAGDAGALFAGTLAACAALLAIRDGGLSPLIPPILFFPVLADVLLTLAYRVGKRRANLLEGHREHLFQIGMRSGMSHRRITLTYWAATAHCGLVGIVAAFAQRVSVVPPGDVGLYTGPYVIAAMAAACLPLAALVVLAGVSLKVSARIRKFARARGLDDPA